MRLTLRTLLAYLDDTLDPAQARLIGQKVAESDVAQKLIVHIKEVIRQRELAVPPTTGPAAQLDVNTVAEYLDNALPAEELSRVEEVCLESDVYLAEIAACHQILTLVLGNPASVPGPARQRMYALSKGRDAARRRPARAATADDVPDGTDESDAKLLLGLPLYSRQGSWLRRIAPLLGILVLLGALGVVISQILQHSEHTPVALRRTGRESGSDTPPERDGSGAKDNGTAEKDGSKDSEPAKDRDGPRDGDSGKDKSAEPPKDGSPVDKPPPPKEKIDEVQVDLPSKDRKVIGQHVPRAKQPSILLQRRPDGNKWEQVVPQGRVSTTDALVSLPGYRSDILLDNKLLLTLWGNLVEFSEFPPLVEAATVLYAPANGTDLDFRLDRGRVVLVNQKPQGAAKVRVRFYEREIWDLTLTPGAVIALERWGLYPSDVPFSKEPGGEGPLVVMGLFVFEGDCAMKSGYQEFALWKDSWFVWDNTGPAPRRVEPLPAQMKEWWTTRAVFPPKSPQAREMSVALDDLALRLGKKGADMDLALAEVLTSPKLKNPSRTLAVFCLGAIDDTARLIDALQDPRAEVRTAAVSALRHWCSRNAENDLALFKVLREKKDFPRLHAEIVLHLLHNPSRADIVKPETYETLIAYLRHDRLAVRELAWWHLSRLVPEGAKKIPYDPAAGEAARDLAYKQWKEFIPDGKLPPFAPVAPK